MALQQTARHGWEPGWCTRSSAPDSTYILSLGGYLSSPDGHRKRSQSETPRAGQGTMQGLPASHRSSLYPASSQELSCGEQEGEVKPQYSH